ncbi:MAG: ATP-binding protein [Pyrinomonadaceae bacterium]
MSSIKHQNLLASVLKDDFIDRTHELEKILRHGGGETRSRGLLVLSAPLLGTSELLRQTYDRFFLEQTKTLPIYFSLDAADKTIKQTAIRFFRTFLQQTVAFRRRDEKLLEVSPDIDELAQMAVPADGFWIDRLVAACRAESVLNDERLFIKNCLTAPIIAGSHGVRPFVIIDNLHEAEHLSGQTDLIEEIKEIYSRAEIQFVLAGRRRFLLNSVQTGNTQLYETEILQIEPLGFSEAGLLAENLAEKYKIRINEQTRDLIARKFLGNPSLIKFLFQAAKEKGCNLDNFHSVEQVYTDEIFDGKISHYYDRIFDYVTPSGEVQTHIIGLLYDVLTGEKRKNPIEAWQARIGQSDRDFHRTMRILNNSEIIRLASNQVELMDQGETLGDYITKRFCLEIEIKPRVLVVVEALKKFLKRAPNTMARFYRFNAAINLRELLGIFNCQEIPADLLDYSIFKEKHKGIEDLEILENLESAVEIITLPQIVYSAPTVEFYPPIGQFTDAEHSAVALGFNTANYTDENEVIWISAEIESKLEADRALAEFWCDRLEMVALVCNFQKYKLWLIAPEGFAPEALEVLRERNAFGSSRKQIELLKKFLNAEDAVVEKRNPNEYEMVVPMGEDTELIAAHTVEEIARRHEFEPKAINQIKTALVEACINATEHSLSPDRKIYQKFAIEEDKIIITISNRGVRLTDKQPVEIKPNDERRGWGLKLLKTLMDDVRFEQVDDGTRISMTKYLNTAFEEKEKEPAI